MNERTVGYLCATDPLDVHSFSGTRLFMLRSLEAAGWNVKLLGRDHVKKRWLRHKLNRVRRRLNKPDLPSRYDPIKHSKLIKSDLASSGASVVFAPASSSFVADWDSPVPIVHNSDATPKLINGYYDQYVKTSPPDIMAKRDQTERRALRRADAVVLSSRWAADSAIDDYGTDPAKVHVVPFGANVQGGADEETILARKLDGPCELLFIGKYWKRKGGDLAVAAAEALNRRGVAARLHVVGSQPESGSLPACVTHHGFLNKSDPRGRAQLEALLTNSHFFVLPTRADCTPVAINEASAYGLPAVSTLTGGVPTVVARGQTGDLLPLDADGEAWADAIAGLWADRQRYQEMALATRTRYEQHLSWDAWGRAISKIIGDLPR